MTSKEIENQIITDDLALSAYLRLKGYHLINVNQQKSKSIFVFNIMSEDFEDTKMEFINSKFLTYYNEIRNLKKLTS